MSVYVDDMRAQFGRMVMCHMTADTTDELIAMADKIGVARKWIQYPGTWKEHFDIAHSKRALAVTFGAVEETQREGAQRRIAKRMPTIENPPMSNQSATQHTPISEKAKSAIVYHARQCEEALRCADFAEQNGQHYSAGMGTSLRQLAQLSSGEAFKWCAMARAKAGTP